MPTTYPPAPPTVTSDGLETISRFLNSPALVQRRLRTLAENRFIADVLLPNRVQASGGAVQYEQNESIFPDRNAESIEPGAKYPLTTLGIGPSLIAAVKKWGLDTTVTDEAIRRLQRNPVDRAFAKLVNGVVKQVDTVALAAVAAAVTQTYAVGTAWSTSTKILRDLLTSRATIVALNQGYEPDLAVVDDLTFAIVASDPTLAGTFMRREDPANPVYTGRFPTVGGLTILPTPNIPVAGRALVLDSTQLGGHADEVPLTSNSIRQEDGPTVVEGWVLRAKRISVPFVQEPASAIWLTGI
jgi:hypothetical protein